MLICTHNLADYAMKFYIENQKLKKEIEGTEKTIECGYCGQKIQKFEYCEHCINTECEDCSQNNDCEIYQQQLDQDEKDGAVELS